MWYILGFFFVLIDLFMSTFHQVIEILFKINYRIPPFSTNFQTSVQIIKHLLSPFNYNFLAFIEKPMERLF